MVELAAQVDVAAPEQIRLDRRLRDHLRRCRIHAGETVAVAALVELVGQAAHERGAEDVGLPCLRAQDHARGIPRAAGVHPREVSEQPLLAERQLLSSESGRDRGLGVADVGEARAEIERAAEGRRRRTDLPCPRRAHPARWPETTGCLEAVTVALKRNAAERIGIIAVLDEAAALEPFDALAELAAHAEPRGKHGVEAIGKRRLRRRLHVARCAGARCGVCGLWSAGGLRLRAGDLLLRAGGEWHCE